MFLCSHSSFSSITANHQSPTLIQPLSFSHAWILIIYLCVYICVGTLARVWNGERAGAATRTETGWSCSYMCPCEHVWKCKCHSVISSTSNDLPLQCNGAISLFFFSLFPISFFLPLSICSKIFSCLALWQVICHSEQRGNRLIWWTGPCVCVCVWEYTVNDEFFVLVYFFIWLPTLLIYT